MSQVFSTALDINHEPSQINHNVTCISIARPQLIKQVPVETDSS
jgi:hypothetical protein